MAGADGLRLARLNHLNLVRVIDLAIDEPATPAADVYALGVVFFKLLTGVSLLVRLAATCTGESAAGWKRFFEQYQPVIQKFAAFAGAGREAEDVTQDVFVKLVDVFRNGRYDPKRGSFRAYLATMIR